MNKKHIENRTRELMDQWNVDSSWRIQVGVAKRQFACTNFTRRTVTVSAALAAANPDQLDDTILHEIAHIRAGFQAQHGPEWKRQCLIVGANPEARGDGADVEAKWIAECPSCAKQLKRHRRGKGACGNCCNKHNNGFYSSDFAFVWKPNPAALAIAA